MIYLDSTSIINWLDCKEKYRLGYVENLAPAKPSIHRSYGIAIHKAVESFWKQEPYEDAMIIAYEELKSFPVQLLGVKEQSKLSELIQGLPDMVACYYDSVEWVEPQVVEMEWQELYFTLPGQLNITLCGRIDLVTGGILRDLKTASEIADKERTWKQSFRDQMLRNFGLQLYDWYLCQAGNAPAMVQVDALLKPYRDKKPRLEVIQLPELVTPAYRKRFEQQLKLVCSEIAQYHQEHLKAQPWPMNSNLACNHKFGACEFLKTCLYGSKDHLVQRIEHLEVRK